MKCPKCGAEIELKLLSGNATAEVQKKKRNIVIPLAVAIVLMALAITAVPVLLLFSKKISPPLCAGTRKSTAVSGPIAANIGDEFAIVLDSNKTTGYEWQLSRPLDGGMLKMVKNDYLTDKVDTKRLGAGGQEEWTFRVLKAGKSTISMKYIRPWEKGVKPAREKTFTVIAR